MKSPPNIKIETQNTELLHDGFLGIDRRKAKIIYPNSEHEPAEAILDSVARKAYDAVAIVPYYELNGKIYIYLRSCLRPALMFRDYINDSGREEKNSEYIGNTWEVAAGLIDKDEYGWSGTLIAAQRELYEEIGFEVELCELNKLGPRYFSSVGMCAERIFFFDVKVNPIKRQIPSEDGSPLERGGMVEVFEINELINFIEDGTILDAKTQTGILRLARKLNLY